MKKISLLIPALAFLLAVNAIAQPYADIVTAGYQGFSSTCKEPKSRLHTKNSTDNYVLNFFLPKEFKNGNTLLIRLNSELISSTASPDSAYTSKLTGISMPLGFQFVSANKKWKTAVLVIPKIASDLKDKIDSYDWQYGGIALETYVHSDKLKFKAGLYYNREAFGNFFIPLIGVDWKATDRIYLYGTMPTNYRVEFNVRKNKLYSGLGFKSYTRSFRLSAKNNYDYVRYDEMQIKLFVDYFIYKRIIAFVEFGYSIGKNPWQYKYNTSEQTYVNPVYTPVKNYPLLNIGIAYRMRFDLEAHN